MDRELLDDLKRVSGKQNLLFELAGAALEKPDGIVREVVFPVVGEQTLRDLVKEAKATGPTYRTTLRTVIRNSYKGHYRRMVPHILQRLEFRSNNEHHRPVIQALDLLKRYADSKLQTFPAEEAVPLDGIVRGLWREAVVEKDAKGRYASTGSPMRSVSSRRCATSCDARRSGWSAPTGTATRTRIFRPTSRRGARLIIRR